MLSADTMSTCFRSLCNHTVHSLLECLYTIIFTTNLSDYLASIRMCQLDNTLSSRTIRRICNGRRKNLDCHWTVILKNIFKQRPSLFGGKSAMAYEPNTQRRLIVF